MKLNLLSICSVLLLSAASFGQVTDMGGPLTWKKKDLNNNDVITQVMPGYNQKLVDKQDSISDAAKDSPWRFGYKYGTDFNLANSGTWTILPNGDRVWRLGIHCPGAVSVNLLLEDFNLPEGAGLYLFDKGNTNRIGAYTSENNNPEQQLGTELIIGEHMIVEYFEPQEVQGQGQFTIAHVIHGYRSLNKIQKNLAKALNSSNDCNIDARCPLGNGWDDQIRSVGMIVVNGNGICTGALVNTTSCDYTPYFLTANHCYSGSVANWAFRFNWEVAANDPTLSCATTTNTSTTYNNATNWDQTANGGTVRAVYSSSDMLLVEINLSLTNAQNWGVFFAGWDHSGNAPTQVTGIHHPSGDIKKICRDNTGMTTDTWNFNGDPNTQVWRVNDWEQGVTEPGSSGSPLFDQNGRVIGDLSGGSAACNGTNDNGGYDGYGRFDVSWTGGGTNATRLSNWLDPTGTGATTNDGCDPNTPTLADDAGVNSITAPSGGLCTTTFTPEVVLQNYGSNTLSSATINYDIDGGTNQTFNWTGSLASGASTTITLPNMTTTLGAHVFNASTSNPNATTDTNPANDASTSNFYVGDEDVQIDITLDCWGSETTWTIEDASNNVIASGGPYTDGTGGTVQTANVCLASGQCYDFVINDTYGDGMYGSQYGSCTVDGSYTITQTSGPTTLASIIAVNSDFGTQETNNFCVTTASPAPVANFTGAPTSICVGQSVTFQDLSSNTPTSWAWDFGDGNNSTVQNPTHVFNTPGTYTISLTATNSGGSNTYTENNYIVVNALPNVVASGASTICEGQSVTITGSGATTYSWDNGAGTNATATVSPTTTTTYTVTGTTNGCSATDQVTVTVNALPNVVASGATTICEGQSATITGSGATTYSWDNGAGTNATATVSPTLTTTYTVTGTTNGCSVTDQVTVTVNALPNVVASGATTICEGQSATITGSGATTYSWDNGAGNNASATVSPTSTTTYTVTGTSNGCSATDQVTVTVNAVPNVTASGAATICEGQSTTITGSGATSYSWNNGAGNNASATVSPISTTTYTVTGTTNGCSATDQVTVTVNASPNVVASGASTICAGQSTTITGSGATSYSWDNGAGTNASATVSPTSTTTYTVTGTTNGCSATDQVTVTVNALPNVIASGAATICEGQSATITGSGATSYSWDNGAGTNASATVSPTTTTTYTVTGTTNGCSATDQVTVTVNPNPVITSGTVTNPNTCATATGSIEVTGLGTGNVTWTGAASGSANGVNLPYTITGLAAGTYTISFVSAAGCSSNTFSQSLSDPTPPVTPTISPSGATTFCDGGSVTLSSSYGSGNTWSDNSTGSTLVVSTSGTYSVNYTDGNGCSASSAPITITVNSNPTVTASGATTICEGQSATITASGATTYSWDNGAGTNATATVSPTSTTTYTLTGTTNGCSATDQVTVTVNPVPTVMATATGSTTICAGETTVLNASGATTYSWDNGAGTSASAFVSPTATTIYTVTGTTNGCSATDQVTITVNALPNVVASGATTICAGQSATITGSGATSYSWDNGAGTNASATVSPTTTTTYMVTGTTNGCSATDQVTVTVNALPNVVASGAATICAGQSATITGSGATSYSWDNGAGTNASATVSPTSTTTYTVTGTTNGCSATDQVTVTVNALPNVVASGATTICEGQSATITGSGATSYSWDNGAGTNATASVSPTSTTTYTVTGTTNGCSATDQVTVTVNALPNVVASGAATICEGQSATITGSGATSYSWDNGAGTNATATVSPTSTTTYTVTGTTNGCSATDQVTVTVNALPNVVASGATSICEGQSATITGSGATTYSWDNGVGTNASATVSPTTTTTYTVTGTTNGCSATDQVTVTVNAATNSTQDVEICEGSTYTILGSTYSVSGTYTDVTTNAAGCDSTITTNLTVNPVPTVSIEPSPIDTLCLSSDPITLVGTPGSGTFSGNGVSGGVFFPSTAGIGSHVITYTYTDANGCTGTSTVLAIVDECTNSLNEVGFVGVSLFPNPNEGIFTISGLDIGTDYQIYDERGRLVSTGTTATEEQEVELLDVQTGIYYLYTTQNGRRGSLKFLITK